MMRLGVTGTDTGVGKTVVTCALTALLRSRGLRTGVMKPVETGVTRGEPGSDHVLLAAAAGVDPFDAAICPVVLSRAAAPWVAARGEGVELSVATLDDAFTRASDGKDCVLVEGAGGLLVPITQLLRFDGLFARWELDLLIVAADRLGALNHTLLTVDAARRAGLRVRGVVLNRMQKLRAMPPGAENASALRDLLPEVPVVEFPHIELLRGTGSPYQRGAPFDFAQLGDAAAACGLPRLLFGSEA